MGRVYDINPDIAKDERRGYKCKVESLGFSSWTPAKMVVRLEFDGDVDEGPALVTAWKMTDSGAIAVFGPDHQPEKHTYRDHVRVIHPVGPTEMQIEKPAESLPPLPPPWRTTTGSPYAWCPYSELPNLKKA